MKSARCCNKALWNCRSPSAAGLDDPGLHFSPEFCQSKSNWRYYFHIRFSRLSVVMVLDCRRKPEHSILLLVVVVVVVVVAVVIVLIILLVWFFLLNPESRMRLTEPDTSGTHSAPALPLLFSVRLCLRIRPSAVGWTGVRAGQTSLRTGTQLPLYIANALIPLSRTFYIRNAANSWHRRLARSKKTGSLDEYRHFKISLMNSVVCLREKRRKRNIIRQ